MKTVRFIVTLAMATIPFTASAQSAREMEEWRWHNVLEILPHGQYLNNTQTPMQTLRPYRGTHIRVSVPRSCGEIRYSGITAYGRDQFNRRLVLDIKRIAQTTNTYAEEYYYDIRNGRATAFEIGMNVFISNPHNCAIEIAQADQRVDGNGGSSGSCEEYRSIACPMVYAPATCYATGFNGSSLGQVSGGNECSAEAQLKERMCLQRGLHHNQDYKISCVRDRF